MAAGTQMSEKDSDQVSDTEITLSTGKLLGIFFALAVLCGVFFTMGYLLGKSASAGGRTEIISSTPSGGSTAKPAAGNKAQQGQASNCPPDSPNCSSSAPAGDNSSPRNADAAVPPSSSGKSGDQSSPSSAADRNGSPGSFMVQVAAVSRQEDAEILKTALQKKQYPVFIANSSGDPLFHVQVGPFTDRKDAEAMKTKLAGDGYNAIVK
jgi:DedD protein